MVLINKYISVYIIMVFLSITAYEVLDYDIHHTVTMSN